MATERWTRVEILFNEAADLPGPEQSAFLDRVCSDDEELRREVEILLDADIPQSGLIKAAFAGAVEQLFAGRGEDTQFIGQRIGHYLITGLIGTGGMGAVYHAVRDDAFRMEVAIKVLKRGTDTEAAVMRFRTERQILAGLRHPYMAALLDGGATETGLPYFVMEYVEGKPLLEYAEPLPLRQRLELFQSVCSAVHYAHQKLIVHRDIKPANILVTPEGIPKLLDFGIAKLLDPSADGATTASGVRLMTPDYASPEQVRGESVTAATDIYSLGTVLYEMLTGQRAHHIEAYSADEVEKEICIRAPKKPSVVAKDVDPALDNIVLMALRKEPQRRYASVEQLSRDLDRFVHDLPVQARNEGLLYRCRKFLKRNRAFATTAAISATLAVALVAGLGRFRTPSQSAMRSIAVLPLENLSGDREQEYFADGMTDALINDLARIHSLQVISRTSTMTFKGAHKTLPEIARSLGVQTIAEGSVLRAGDRVRITVRLVDAPRDRPVWSGRYEGELKDVLVLQSRAAAAIAGEIP